MIDLVTPSWFGVQESPLPPQEPDFTTKAKRETCPTCHKSYKQVFDDGWMCLNATCSSFSSLDGRNYDGSRAWNPKFLNERNKWVKKIIPPMKLIPDTPATRLKESLMGTSISAWNGMVCPKCGRCNSRVEWDEWKCATMGCTFQIPIDYKPVPRSSLVSDHAFEAEGHSIPFNKHQKPVILKKSGFRGYWRKITYELSPGNYVTHYLANQVINRQPGGADEVLEKLQCEKMGLQRLPLANSPGK